MFKANYHIPARSYVLKKKHLHWSRGNMSSLIFYHFV